MIRSCDLGEEIYWGGQIEPDNNEYQCKCIVLSNNYFSFIFMSLTHFLRFAECSGTWMNVCDWSASRHHCRHSVVLFRYTRYKNIHTT